MYLSEHLVRMNGYRLLMKKMLSINLQIFLISERQKLIIIIVIIIIIIIDIVIIVLIKIIISITIIVSFMVISLSILFKFP